MPRENTVSLTIGQTGLVGSTGVLEHNGVWSVELNSSKYVDVVVAGLKGAGELAGLKETRELTSALEWLSFYSQRSKQALRNSVEITHRHDSYKSMISYRGRHQRERKSV